MATIALIWELGADLGHLGHFLPMAREFKARGHTPVLVLRDISRVETLFSGEGVEYLQAPLWLPPIQGLPPDLNFTETLFRFGFLDPGGLTSLLRAWRSLLSRLAPDILLFDHAPTALLATHGSGIPRVLTGNGFSIPPATRPLPRYRYWAPEERESSRLEETERRVVRHANIALEAIGAGTIRQVSDLYDCDATFIASHPLIDAYGQRSDADYLGSIGNETKGSLPAWPSGAGKRVFAYLKPQHGTTEPMLAAIQQARTPALIYAPGISTDAIRRHASPLVEFSDVPFRMDRIAAEADVGICHAGGTASSLLLAGKPVLLLPTQMEQTMVSRRITDLGAGLYLPIDAKPGALRKMLGRLLEEATFTEAAQRIANSLPMAPQSQAIARLVDRCEELLAARVPH
jgi:UDP:flavonoid glycosyltransferase YjiC (YdhE family)